MLWKSVVSRKDLCGLMSVLARMTPCKESVLYITVATQHICVELMWLWSSIVSHKTVPLSFQY